MDEFLYLEADEEITSVIDKLKGLEAKSIGLVIPRGALVLQSVVNLKLLKNQADEQDKKIALVTQDAVGRNLANQIGLTIFADVDSTEPLEPVANATPRPNPNEELEVDMSDKSADEEIPSNIKVKRYDDGDQSVAPRAQIGTADEAHTPHKSEPPMAAPASEPDRKDEFVSRHIGEDKRETKYEQESDMPIKGRDAIPTKKKKKSAKGKVFLSIGIILFIGILGLANFALAKLNVKLTVPAEVYEKTSQITIEKDRPAVDEQNFIVPGKQIEKESIVKKTANSTGKKNTGDKAKGTLTYQNDAGVDEGIPAGTTVRTSGGFEFTTDSAISVPKASLNANGDKVLGKSTGSVTGKEAGAEGNFPSNTSYTISGKSKVTISGSTSGGVTKTVKVVTASDISSAKRDIETQAKQQMFELLKQTPDSVVLEDAIRVETSEIKTTKNALDEADTFDVTAKAKGIVIVFKESDFRSIIIKKSESELQGKSLLVDARDTIVPTLVSEQSNVGKLTVAGLLSSHIGPKIEIEDLKNNLKFMTKSQISSELSKVQNIKQSSFELTPVYVLPMSSFLGSNIKIELEYINK